MLDVYHVIFTFEVNKDSVIIQRDDQLCSYMTITTVPSVLSIKLAAFFGNHLILFMFNMYVVPED